MVNRRSWPTPTSWDVLVAVLILLVEAFAAGRDLPGVTSGLGAMAGLTMQAWLVLLVGSGALLWRRHRPLVVLSMVVGAYVAWHVLGYEGGPSLAILVAVYGVGRCIADVQAQAIAVGAATAVFVAVAIYDGDTIADVALAATLIPLLPWYIGRRVTARQERLLLLEERAELLERDRAAEIRRALDEERRSIARELHDVVAHRVSLMTVQAGAAQAVVDKDRERAVQAMTAVEDAGRAALDELRHLLDVLGPQPGDQPRKPAASLVDLARVREQMVEAGLDVTITVDDLVGTIPTRVDLSAFRIVQESLTNTLRHAGPGARATVRITVDGDELQIEVTDDGSGGSSWSGGSGRGLAGMRERAELLGGRFAAGSIEGGGFRVRASLPLRGPKP